MSVIGKIADGVSNWFQTGADNWQKLAADEEAKEIQKNGDKIEDERYENHEQQDEIDEQIKDLERQKEDLQSEDEEMKTQQDEMGYTDENRKTWEENTGKDAPGKQSETSEETKTLEGQNVLDSTANKTTTYETSAANETPSANSINISIGTGAGAGTPSVAQLAQNMANTGLTAENPAAAIGFNAANWIKGSELSASGINYDEDSMYANAEMDSGYANAQNKGLSGIQSSAIDVHSQLHKDEPQQQNRTDMAQERFGHIEENFDEPNESFEY